MTSEGRFHLVFGILSSSNRKLWFLNAAASLAQRLSDILDLVLIFSLSDAGIRETVLLLENKIYPAIPSFRSHGKAEFS